MTMARAILAALLAMIFSIASVHASGSFPWFPWYPLIDNQTTGSLSKIPACEDGEVKANLLARFNQTEFVYWGGFHRLDHIEGLVERAHRERENDKIARRWCAGMAHFADGSQRRIVIEMASNVEWLGLTYSLAYCIAGLDRGYVHGRDCEGLTKRQF